MPARVRTRDANVELCVFASMGYSIEHSEKPPLFSESNHPCGQQCRKDSRAPVLPTMFSIMSQHRKHEQKKRCHCRSYLTDDVYNPKKGGVRIGTVISPCQGNLDDGCYQLENNAYAAGEEEISGKNVNRHLHPLHAVCLEYETNAHAVPGDFLPEFFILRRANHLRSCPPPRESRAHAARAGGDSSPPHLSL